MAHAVWNADFSRHSPPQTGGGANLITREGAPGGNANPQFARVAGRAGARKRGG